MINELKKEFKIPIGFSDHSGIPSICLAARCFGAEILEFHAVFHKSSFGPDNSSSLTIEEIKSMVNSIRKIERSFKTKKDAMRYEYLLNKDRLKRQMIKKRFYKK